MVECYYIDCLNHSLVDTSIEPSDAKLLGLQCGLRQTELLVDTCVG